MENKVLILNKNGEWWELTNCFVVGAGEEAEKTMYRSAFFTAGKGVTREDILARAERYLAELKKEAK